jgi:hypothetical protein
MSFVISSVVPFPEIAWWCHVIVAEKVCWDTSEHFQKMSARNRYTISAASGSVKLSIPLRGGRDQRTAMKDILISNEQHWQKQHWRTLVSVYNRSPYFEFYDHSLQSLFGQKVERLVDFNILSIHWLKQQLNLTYEEEILLGFESSYPGALSDLRHRTILEGDKLADFPSYSQVFSDRTGFVPNLSLLDVLFAQGPYTLQWLKDNCQRIIYT